MSLLTIFIVCVLTYSTFAEQGRFKRVLLQGDGDLAAAVQLLTTQVNQLTAEVANLKQHNNGGAVYIRWGRTVCPMNGTDLLYTGFAAGNFYNDYGAADFLCLTSDPLWGVYDDAEHSPSAKALFIMTLVTLVLFCVIICLTLAEQGRFKRVLLHGDGDLVAAVQLLTTQVNQQSADITNLKQKNLELESKITQMQSTFDQHLADISSHQTGGAVYVRWGRTYANGGAQFFGKNLYDHDAPCAVCHTSRQASVMIPGRNQCYPGWTKEYAGYLVAGLSGTSHKSPTNYVCLDSGAEYEASDYRDDNGKLMYLVEAMCGSLRCPPYVQYREITCVVCSK
ncbi:hypothetical protein MAR_032765 [Mya arenaria]|uniref:Uncharacterized protein n=1 Tax=Mya arenaria TaxID=6604 RepID=A0ABY7G747_MYAAR|nr:hypothetical protein MAR_032765 [Mya arenaria]